MVGIRIPKIKEFPQDGRFWRVDWIGAQVPSSEITTEPFIQIYLSPFTISSDAPPSKLVSKNAVDWSEQKTIDVGVGQLPFIENGSIWKEGARQKVLAGTNKTFSDLNISKSTVKLVRANHQIDNQFLIPQSQYRLGRGLNSWLVAVEYQGNPYGVLIPAIELIRFYYAISTNLAQAVFSGAFEFSPNSLINNDRSFYQPEDDRVVLGLRQHVTDEEGWAIARILHSNFTKQACLKIYDDFLEQAANRERFINVKASFPFEGKTTLQARVKAIPFEHKDGTTTWHNLVLAIDSCSAPMPYSELTIVRDNDGSKGAPETDIPKEDKKLYQRGDAGKNGFEGKDIQNQKDTNASLLSISLTVASGRFTALAGRKPDKPTKKQSEYRSTGKPIVGLEIEALGTGLGGYGSEEREIQRMNIASDRARRQAAPPSFELYSEAIEYLDSQSGITAKIRQTKYMPLTKPPSKRQWSYLDSARKKPRRVVIADIMINGRYFCLIEFEQRENEHCTVCLLSSGDSAINDVELQRLLLQCSTKNGVWKNISARFEISSLKHTWVDAASLGKTILQRVKVISTSSGAS